MMLVEKYAELLSIKRIRQASPVVTSSPQCLHIRFRQSIHGTIQISENQKDAFWFTRWMVSKHTVEKEMTILTWKAWILQV